MPTRERESLAQRSDLDARAAKPETSSPALATYDRAAMGILPAGRSGSVAGIASQGSGCRGDQAQADGPGPAREGIHRATGCDTLAMKIQLR